MNIEWNIHSKKSSFHPQLLIALLSKMWNTHITANTRRGFLSEEHIVGLSYTKTASPSNWYWQNINNPLTSLHCAVSITPNRPLFKTSSGADYIHWFWFFLTKPRLSRPVSIEVMQMHRIKAFLYPVSLNKKFWLSHPSLFLFLSPSLYFIGLFQSPDWAAVSDNASFLHEGLSVLSDQCCYEKCEMEQSINSQI